MIAGKRVLAVVPARGGSKGIELKNIREVGGVPLVGLVGLVARECPSIDRVVVSTDHPAIADIARRYGIDAPFMRPDDLSGDRVGDVPVLRHALAATEADDHEHYDIVVMLQPTSPLRRPEHVERAISKLVEENLDTVWTVSETDSKAHPLKQLVMRGGLLDYYDERGAAITARQQLTPVYHRNGVAYALTRAWLIGTHDSLMGARTGAVVIEEPMANIDEPLDLEIAEFLYRRRHQ